MLQVVKKKHTHNKIALSTRFSYDAMAIEKSLFVITCINDNSTNTVFKLLTITKYSCYHSNNKWTRGEFNSFA